MIHVRLYACTLAGTALSRSDSANAGNAVVTLGSVSTCVGVPSVENERVR